MGLGSCPPEKFFEARPSLERRKTSLLQSRVQLPSSSIFMLRKRNSSPQPTMSAKSPWNTHAVVGIFYYRPFFAAKITIVSPLPPLYNVESIAEALSYLERHNFPIQCYLYHLHTTLFYGGGDFVVRLLHKSQGVFQDFWQAL